MTANLASVLQTSLYQCNEIINVNFDLLEEDGIVVRKESHREVGNLGVEYIGWKDSMCIIFYGGWCIGDPIQRVKGSPVTGNPVEVG